MTLKNDFAEDSRIVNIKASLNTDKNLCIGKKKKKKKLKTQ